MIESSERVRVTRAKSAHNLKATLLRVYSFDVFEELVETNVCRAVPKDKLPKRGKPRRKVYTDVEARRSGWKALERPRLEYSGASEPPRLVTVPAAFEYSRKKFFWGPGPSAPPSSRVGVRKRHARPRARA